MSTGFVWDERFMWHDTGAAAAFMPAGGFVEPDVHVESPPAKRRIRNLLEVSGMLARLHPLAARPATREEALRFHAPDYLDWLEQASAAGGGDAGEPDLGKPAPPDREPSPSPFAANGFEIAMLAAGGCLVAVEAVLEGTVANAYALVRPPGHHACADRGMGTCLLNNVALAALHARARGAARVAVLDWDVHHGNGTQDAFWRDPSALVISIHQDRCYPPDTGSLSEVGEGPGEGYTINVPLPPGSGPGAYEATMERVVAPALRAFAPDIVLVSCGLDASVMDPLGRAMLHSEGFRMLARRLLDVAGEVCGGRVVMCHEGGYSPAYAPFCGLAVIEELAGERTGVEDPFMAGWSRLGYLDLQQHQERVVDAAAALVRRLRPG